MSMQGVVIGVTGNFDRQILSRAVRKAGGRVDAIIHKNLNYLVSDEMAIKLNTQRVRKAVRLGIPIVSEKYLLARLKAGKEIDHTPFLLEVKRQAKKMAKIGEDGPSQGSANLQIEQSEEVDEEDEEDEEMGQQLVRSGKGSSITRPAMMGGDKKDTDVELSTRRQKRELISSVGVLEAKSGAVDDGPLMLTASPKRHAKTATDYFLSELDVHTDPSSRGKKLSSSKQLFPRPTSPLGTFGGRAVKMVGGSDEHAAAEEEDEKDAIKKRRFIREIRRLNKSLALLPRSMRYQRWLYPYTLHAHTHPHTHTHTHTHSSACTHGTGALTTKHD